eukprot:COSAG06_NODE_496_length_15043_cov_8.883565_9_plen_49_part_00
MVEQQLDKMEQLVMRGAVSVCMPAQYLLRGTYIYAMPLRFRHWMVARF